MRLIILVVSMILCSLCSVDAQTNRYSTRTPLRSNYQPKVYDGSATRELAMSIYEQRKAAAIQKCLSQYVETVESMEDNEFTDVELIYPTSEWIKSLRFVQLQGNVAFIVMATDTGGKFIFKTNKEIWDNWKSSSSKGEFYNNYVRDNKNMSMYFACEKSVTGG